MVDTATHEEIRVLSGGATAGPYLWTSVDQLPRIVEKLDQHGIFHWVESHRFSINGKPAETVINFGLAGDREKIQSILDETD